MKLIKIVKNFISEKEAKILSNWTTNNYKKPYFIDPKMNNDVNQTRFTTRHANVREGLNHSNYKVKYPDQCYDIQNRIFTYLNLTKRNLLPFPFFTDGIVTTICFPPGSCVRHKDPVYYSNTYTLHCNFCTQLPEDGGTTIIEGEEYKINNKDMLIYITSHLDHEVTECFGQTPRILWVYGFFIDNFHLNEIFNVKKYSYC